MTTTPVPGNPLPSVARRGKGRALWCLGVLGLGVLHVPLEAAAHAVAPDVHGHAPAAEGAPDLCELCGAGGPQGLPAATILSGPPLPSVAPATAGRTFPGGASSCPTPPPARAPPLT